MLKHFDAVPLVYHFHVAIVIEVITLYHTYISSFLMFGQDIRICIKCACVLTYHISGGKTRKEIIRVRQDEIIGNPPLKGRSRSEFLLPAEYYEKNLVSILGIDECFSLIYD